MFIYVVSVIAMMIGSEALTCVEFLDEEDREMLGDVVETKQCPEGSGPQWEYRDARSYECFLPVERVIYSCHCLEQDNWWTSFCKQYEDYFCSGNDDDWQMMIDYLPFGGGYNHQFVEECKAWPKNDPRKRRVISCNTERSVDWGCGCGVPFEECDCQCWTKSTKESLKDCAGITWKNGSWNSDNKIRQVCRTEHWAEGGCILEVKTRDSTCDEYCRGKGSTCIKGIGTIEQVYGCRRNIDRENLHRMLLNTIHRDWSGCYQRLETQICVCEVVTISPTRSPTPPPPPPKQCGLPKRYFGHNCPDGFKEQGYLCVGPCGRRIEVPDADSVPNEIWLSLDEHGHLQAPTDEHLQAPSSQ